MMDIDEDSIRKKVDALEQIIKDSTNEIELIQQTCPHAIKRIRDINPNGSADLRIVCKTCSHIMGYPSQDELDKWMSASK